MQGRRGVVLAFLALLGGSSCHEAVASTEDRGQTADSAARAGGNDSQAEKGTGATGEPDAGGTNGTAGSAMRADGQGNAGKSGSAPDDAGERDEASPAGDSPDAHGGAGEGGGTPGDAGGSEAAQAGGGAGAPPGRECDLDCEAGQHCERIPTTCATPPCPSQPTCIESAWEPSGAACGSRGLPACPAGEFCRHPPSANCGATDAPGTCMTCGAMQQPVCGCDGTTYGHPCHAALSGVSVRHDGECNE